MTEILQGENNFVVEYFSKYRDNPNFSKYSEEFKNLTEIRYKGDIALIDYVIPDLGPSDDLINFPEKLTDWSERDRMELNTVIKIFDAGEIEDWSEVLILIEIIKNNDDNYPKILDKIVEDITKNIFNDLENYNDLLKFAENGTMSFIYSSIWKFIISSLCD